MTYDPHEHAEVLGLNVETYHLRTCFGLYVPDRNLILLRPRLRAAVERSVLAHELAHHLLGHTAARPGLWGAKQEQAADRTASRLLISFEQLRDVARTTPDKGRWAVELGVTGDILDAYLEALHSAPQRPTSPRLAAAS